MVKQVLQYFLTHPEAADDLEGIVRWRLMRQSIEDTVTQTALVLRLLVERGLLIEVRRPTGPPVFTLNADRAADAEKLLAGGLELEGES